VDKWGALLFLHSGLDQVMATHAAMQRLSSVQEMQFNAHQRMNTMNTEYNRPTLADLDAIERQARELRAQMMRDVFAAVFSLFSAKKANVAGAQAA
jgi:7-cyano-7-deazaguanine synthase in queuosine biosynthesis